MSDIQLDYVVPAEDLSPFVTVFYHFRTSRELFDDTERADHAQLRFRLAGTSEYRFVDGNCQHAEPVHVIGATTGACRSIGAGPIEIFGMGLTPAGWHALLGIDASGMVNRVLDGAALFGVRATDALVALRGHDGLTAAMVADIQVLLRALLSARDGSATLAFVRLVDTWLAGSPSPEIEDLITAGRLSRRQVERRCKALYGCPPKLLARKYRALRAAVALASGSDSLDTLLTDGFYDQSHMIREIKHFTGLTPRRMRDEPGPLAQLTIVGRTALGGQVGPMISET